MGRNPQHDRKGIKIPIAMGILAGIGGMFAINYASLSLSSQAVDLKLNHKPTVSYEDVNGDGIADKITRTKVLSGGPLVGGPPAATYTIEEKVLFGVNVNGKIVYLPKDLYQKVIGHSNSLQ